MSQSSKIPSKLWGGNDTHSYTMIEYLRTRNTFCFNTKLTDFFIRDRKITEGKGRVCFRLLRRLRSLRELLDNKILPLHSLFSFYLPSSSFWRILGTSDSDQGGCYILKSGRWGHFHAAFWSLFPLLTKPRLSFQAPPTVYNERKITCDRRILHWILIFPREYVKHILHHWQEAKHDWNRHVSKFLLSPQPTLFLLPGNTPFHHPPTNTNRWLHQRWAPEPTHP